MNTRRPRLLDLYCGAGGSAVGYHRAGFDVVGVDIKPQPRYPFAFVRGDALQPPVKLTAFDAIHASPPCQRFSTMTRRWGNREHPDQVAATRALLVASGRPYVIENVPGAPLSALILLCGTMFGLGAHGAQLRRHRYFECWPVFALSPMCAHNDGRAIGGRTATIGVWGETGGRSSRDDVEHWGAAARREAMGIDWMTNAELTEAIPPAYTEWLGRQMLDRIAA